MAALLLTACWLYARKDFDRRAGIFLGLIVSLKIFFGLLLIYFIVQERWRICISALATYIICFLVGGMVFGHVAYIHYYLTLHNIAWYVASWNASLWGFLLRVFDGAEGNVPLLNSPITAYMLIILGDLALIIYLI